MVTFHADGWPELIILVDGTVLLRCLQYACVLCLVFSLDHNISPRMLRMM